MPHPVHALETFVIDPEVRLSFSVVENPGVYSLLIGSGVSRAAAIPTGWDITLDLVRRLAAVEGIGDSADWAAWYRERFGCDPGYSSLLDALSITPAERRSILHQYIEPSAADLEEGRRVPTKAHRAIAELVRTGFIRVIITTNFDRLLETALSAVGVEAVVIKSVDDLAGASPLPHSRCYLMKLHGDYLDNRILNTEDELASYPLTYDRLLDRIFDEYGLIVSGWSGEWDPALRAAISRAPNRRYPTWWISRGEPSIPAQDLIAKRAANVISVPDADSFFSKLKDSVDTLAKARRPSPDTIELLLATTKRNLATPERRIDLADAFSEQLDKVVRQTTGLPVAVPNVTKSIVIERWIAMEGIGEPLARMGGLAGRWGNGSEMSHVREAIKAILAGQQGNGSTALLALSIYPAYLLFLTYALGLTKAERWPELFQWLRQEIVQPHRSRSSIGVTSLFMQAWDGMEPELWKQWPEMERRKTPWADHLVDAVVPWSRDFGLPNEAAIENYRTLELLGCFAALTDDDENQLLQLTGPTWMPYGQTMWATEARVAILRRLGAEDLQPKLLAAGFCRGSSNHWAGALNAIDRLASNVSWR